MPGQCGGGVGVEPSSTSKWPRSGVEAHSAPENSPHWCATSLTFFDCLTKTTSAFLIDVASLSLGVLTQHLHATGVAAVDVAIAVTTQTLDRIAFSISAFNRHTNLLTCLVATAPFSVLSGV